MSTITNVALNFTKEELIARLRAVLPIAKERDKKAVAEHRAAERAYLDGWRDRLRECLKWGYKTAKESYFNIGGDFGRWGAPSCPEPLVEKIDSHLGTVWLFIDGTIREHPVEQCVLSPNYRPGKLSQSKRKALWDRVYHHMRPQIIVRCGGVCERCSDARVTEVHHELKRQHPLANVPRHLAALCDPCHDHIHANPEESYAEGWLIHVEAEYAA